jgi:hypothetical protein
MAVSMVELPDGGNVLLTPGNAQVYLTLPSLKRRQT